MPTIIARHNIGHAVVIHYNNSTKNAYRIYKLTESNGPVPDLPNGIKNSIYASRKEMRDVVISLIKQIISDDDGLVAVRESVPMNRVPELRQYAMKLRKQIK